MNPRTMPRFHSATRARCHRDPSRLPKWSLLFLCAFGAISPPLQVAAVGDAVEHPVKRVLILQSFGSDFAPYNILSSSFRSELAESLGEPIVFHEVMVTEASANDPEAERALTQYLDALGAERPPDLAVTLGGLACRFVQAHRERLFPATAGDAGCDPPGEQAIDPRRLGRQRGNHAAPKRDVPLTRCELGRAAGQA